MRWQIGRKDLAPYTKRPVAAILVAGEGDRDVCLAGWRTRPDSLVPLGSWAIDPIRSPQPGSCCSTCRCAGCAGPICIWPRVTFLQSRVGWSLATRLWESSAKRARAASGSGPVTGSGCTGWVPCAAPAGLPSGRREPVSRADLHGGGTATADTPNSSLRPRTSSIEFRPPLPTSMPRRCCARASSGTARSNVRRFLPADAWASTVSADPPTSQPRWPATKAPRSTS